MEVRDKQKALEQRGSAFFFFFTVLKAVYLKASDGTS
jgi:hypothetical protein